MNVLVGCERSGVVREAFRKRGHDAWSCDLVGADDGSEHHLEMDVLDAIEAKLWDLIILHPPCTYIAVSGNAHHAGTDRRREATEWTVDLFQTAIDCADRVCLENPVGLKIPGYKPQWVQPYQFGHDASKRTGLWLHNLPPLNPTGFVEPAYHTDKGLPRWSNQTPGGQDKSAPSPDRGRLRSVTYSGIAAAMADQWGELERPRCS